MFDRIYGHTHMCACVVVCMYVKWNSASNLIFNHGMNKSKTKTQKCRERAHSRNLMHIAFRRANIPWFLFIVNIISVRVFALLVCVAYTKAKQNKVTNGEEHSHTRAKINTEMHLTLQMDEQVWIVRMQNNPTFSVHAQKHVWASVRACLLSKSSRASLEFFVLFRCLAEQVTSGGNDNGSGSDGGKTATGYSNTLNNIGRGQAFAKGPLECELGHRVFYFN